MFIPGMYRAPDPSWTKSIILQYPLALLVSSGPANPYATHCPVIFPDDVKPDSQDDLIGKILLGHLNRANPHWQNLKARSEALLVFFGPNTYVSPTNYGFEPAAPTWDFAAVHLRGSIMPILDSEISLKVVMETVERFEERFAQNWNSATSLSYFRKILPAVGAFSFEVHDVESMFKFSQEQSSETQKKVAKTFAASKDSMRHDVAKLILTLNQCPASTSASDTTDRHPKRANPQG